MPEAFCEKAVLLHQLGLVASQIRSPSGRSSAPKVRWLRYIALILVKHRTPHMIVKRVEIRRIRWPLFLPDKLWGGAISAKPVLRQWCCVSRPIAKLFFFSSDSCNFCFMWMIWKKFSENAVVFLSIIWGKFQEFKLHGFREIEFFLGGCFLCRTLYTQPRPRPNTCFILYLFISKTRVTYT